MPVSLDSPPKLQQLSQLLPRQQHQQPHYQQPQPQLQARPLPAQQQQQQQQWHQTQAPQSAPGPAWLPMVTVTTSGSASGSQLQTSLSRICTGARMVRSSQWQGTSADQNRQPTLVNRQRFLLLKMFR